jgi:nicotinic acid phosphoribosyltransferase
MPKRVSVEKPKKPRNSNKDKKIKKPTNTRRRRMKGGIIDNYNNYNTELANRNQKLTSCDLPVLGLTDSYKLSHQLMYAIKDDVGYGIKKMVAYGECRGPLKIDKKTIDYKDDKGNKISELRLVNFGLRYIIENYINKQINQTMIDDIDAFYNKHGFLNNPYPYNKKILENLKGKYPPVRIYGLKEGTVMLPRTPVYVIEAEEEFAPFVTYFETILTMVWYPISVATLSKCCKDIFTRKYNDVGAPEHHYIFLDFSLHDFGFRGASSIETSTIGGMAHLLNFKGTDTLSAAYYAQYKYNNGEPVGESIAASEHSVMTSYKKEFDAFYQILKNFAGGREEERDTPSNIEVIKYYKPPFAVVMDSYDYENALINVFAPAIKKYIEIDREQLLGKKNNVPFLYHYTEPISLDGFKTVSDLLDLSKLDSGIFGDKTTAIFSEEEIKLLPLGFAFTFRPDSGNPYVAVIQSLIAGLKMFGIDEQGSFVGKNEILYIKPKFVRTIQGDGINVFTIQGMLDAITEPKYVSSNGKWAFSPYSLLCGMGGGLLQKVNRDTVNFATKLCYVEYDNFKADDPSTYKIVMKAPETAPDKMSLPGKPYVKKDENGILRSDVNPNNPDKFSDEMYKAYLENMKKNKEQSENKARQSKIDELFKKNKIPNYNYAHNIYEFIKTNPSYDDLIYLTEKTQNSDFSVNDKTLILAYINKKIINIKYRGGEGDYGNEMELYYDGIDSPETPLKINEFIKTEAKFNITEPDKDLHKKMTGNEFAFNSDTYFDNLKYTVANNWNEMEKYIQYNLNDARTKELLKYQEYINYKMKSSNEEKDKSQYVEDTYCKGMNKRSNLECLHKSPFIKYVFSKTNDRDDIKPSDVKDYELTASEVSTEVKARINKLAPETKGGRSRSKSKNQSQKKKNNKKQNKEKIPKKKVAKK